MNKKDVLRQAMNARIEEVAGYQLNIDNYKLAIPLAEADSDLSGFAEQLKSLLATEIVEQKKALIMLRVIEMQLEERDAC